MKARPQQQQDQTCLPGRPNDPNVHMSHSHLKERTQWTPVGHVNTRLKGGLIAISLFDFK